MVFTNLPVGADYTVTEDTNGMDGYAIFQIKQKNGDLEVGDNSVSGKLNDIAEPEDGMKQDSALKVLGTVVNDTFGGHDTLADYKNCAVYTNGISTSLTIKKTVTGADGEYEKEWAFDITLTPPEKISAGIDWSKITYMVELPLELT